MSSIPVIGFVTNFSLSSSIVLSLSRDTSTTDVAEPTSLMEGVREPSDAWELYIDLIKLLKLDEFQGNQLCFGCLSLPFCLTGPGFALLHWSPLAFLSASSPLVRAARHVYDNISVDDNVSHGC